MDILEQRANQAYPKWTAENYEQVIAARRGYIKGATEQKSVDLNEFKEYLEKKKAQYSQATTTFDVMRKKVFNEIINELFGD